MKILAIDYGTKRIGLAISDETQTLAREYGIWSADNDNAEFWQKLEPLIEQEGIERIVLGMPINMSGETTQKSEEVQKFNDQLQQRLTIPIELVDERLSSVMAEQISGQGTKSHENIDSLAAQIFLQNYLNQNKTNQNIDVTI